MSTGSCRSNKPENKDRITASTNSEYSEIKKSINQAKKRIPNPAYCTLPLWTPSTLELEFKLGK